MLSSFHSVNYYKLLADNCVWLSDNWTLMSDWTSQTSGLWDKWTVGQPKLHVSHISIVLKNSDKWVVGQVGCRTSDMPPISLAKAWFYLHEVTLGCLTPCLSIVWSCSAHPPYPTPHPSHLHLIRTKLQWSKYWFMLVVNVTTDYWKVYWKYLTIKSFRRLGIRIMNMGGLG